IRDLWLFDSAHDLAPDAASAATAVLTQHDGVTYTFEIIRTEPDTNMPDSYHARLVRIADRNGNATTIAYQFSNPNAIDAALGFDRSRLWLINTVTDAYGLSAGFSYIFADGQWVV